MSDEFDQMTDAPFDEALSPRPRAVEITARSLPDFAAR